MCSAVSWACTIPVFRFALDRWPADGLKLVMPSSAAKDRDLSLALLPYRGNGAANLKIEEADQPAGTESRLYLSNDDRREKPIWHGTLTPSELGALVDSPKRQELLKRLLDGESVVWVVVDGGGDKDSAEAERVSKRLHYLEKVVELPPQDPDDPDSQLGPGPALKLKLTSMRISARDDKEKLFCAMLAGAKCADVLAKGQAFAAAVFGRGRVLGSFPLSELDDTALEDISMFLTGRCSCRVKNQSPGWDVLLKVDWDSALQKAQEGRKREVPARSEPEVVRILPKKE